MRRCLWVCRAHALPYPFPPWISRAPYQRGAVVEGGVQVGTGLEQPPDVLHHALLCGSPGLLDLLLGDPCREGVHHEEAGAGADRPGYSPPHRWAQQSLQSCTGLVGQGPVLPGVPRQPRLWPWPQPALLWDNKTYPPTPGSAPSLYVSGLSPNCPTLCTSPWLCPIATFLLPPYGPSHLPAHCQRSAQLSPSQGPSDLIFLPGHLPCATRPPLIPQFLQGSLPNLHLSALPLLTHAPARSGVEGLKAVL